MYIIDILLIFRFDLLLVERLKIKAQLIDHHGSVHQLTLIHHLRQLVLPRSGALMDGLDICV